MAAGRTKAPDHSTIARFRTGFLAEACKGLFYQIVRKLAAMGELEQETVFIDDTKLEACANKYTFVWRKSVGKWEEKMFVKIQEAVKMVNREYMQVFLYEGNAGQKTSGRYLIIWMITVKKIRSASRMDGEKVSIRNTTNYSGDL